MRDFFYDLLGRLIGVADENVSNPATAYSSANYGIANRRMTYDRLSRLSTVTVGYGTSAASTTTYNYDAHDNLVKVTDGDGRITKYLYDDFGQLTAVNSPDSGVTWYAYDSVGNLIERKEIIPSGNPIRTLYSYDTRNRLTLEQSFVGTTNANLNVNYYYGAWNTSDGAPAPTSASCPDGSSRDFAPSNLTGRLAWVKHPAGATYYGYNAFGDVTAVWEQQGPVFAICSVAITRYEYDAVGRLLAMNYPSNRRVEYSYASQALYPSSVVVKETPTAPSGTTLLSNMVTDVDGGIKSYNASGVTFTRSVDYAGQVTRRFYDATPGPDFDWTIVQRDGVGNITSIDDGAGPAAMILAYDGQYRLNNVDATGLRGYQDCSMTYDDAGNRTSETCNGRTITYNYEPNSDKLDSVVWYADNVCGAGTVQQVRDSWNADARGRLTAAYTQRFPGSTELSTFAYDARNRLTTAVAGPTTYTYTYNHRMQRVGKNWAGNDRDYVYNLSGQLLHETTATGNQDYVWLNGELVGVVTSATPTSTKYLAALDQIGTPQRLYGSDGKPKWAADYEAFGKATTYVPGKTYAPSVEMNIRFPGQYFDAETGMHYNWYRYYDPSSGRYIGPDPFVERIGLFSPTHLMTLMREPRDWMAYVYGRNDALSYVDPNGLKCVKMFSIESSMPPERTYPCVIQIQGKLNLCMCDETTTTIFKVAKLIDDGECPFCESEGTILYKEDIGQIDSTGSYFGCVPISETDG